MAENVPLAADEMLTLHQAAAQTGRGYPTLQDAASQGELVARKLGGRWYVRPADLATYLAQPKVRRARRVAAPPPTISITSLPPGHSAEQLIAQLKALGVEQVIDVRADARGGDHVPRSGLLRAALLSPLCRKAGLRYAAYPELSYPSRQRVAKGARRIPIGTSEQATTRLVETPAFISLRGLVHRRRICLLGEPEGPAAEWPTHLAEALAADAVVQPVPRSEASQAAQ